MRVKAYRFCHR